LKAVSPILNAGPLGLSARLAVLNAAPREPESQEVIAAARTMRNTLDTEPLPLTRVAASIAETCGRIGSRKHRQGRATLAAIAERWGWSSSSLPIHLVCEPWTDRERVHAFGQTLHPRRELFGFILPGNLPGAGLHEIAAALLAGCAVMVKTATAEPVFFTDFARTLAEVDAVLGTRIAVFSWRRERVDLTAVMRASCDRLVAFGDDATIAELAGQDDCAGFGARVSGIVLTGGARNDDDDERLVDMVAQEITFFEQRGCLSPHHVFVDESEGCDARDWARRLAIALDVLAQGQALPPRSLALADAAAIRHVRETARWRALGGHPIELWEGPIPGWTVVYDRNASFTVSPGFRTVFVSPFFEAADLERRLAPVAGRVEAIGLASFGADDSSSRIVALREVIERADASWICEPGRMQAPPVDWLHGGGAFLRMLREVS
jgi:acyl-CoA reductase LuxC